MSENEQRKDGERELSKEELQRLAGGRRIEEASSPPNPVPSPEETYDVTPLPDPPFGTL